MVFAITMNKSQGQTMTIWGLDLETQLYIACLRCWTVNENQTYFWITRGPITASIVLNLIFFINITRVLFLKMFSSQAIQSRRYRYRRGGRDFRRGGPMRVKETSTMEVIIDWRMAVSF
ncbi:uncharacterized protein TNCV_232301 [Trichonephila clavipes]|nr:uncharacterized protein TNCV_232301 [Trichonephila clavipes]